MNIVARAQFIEKFLAENTKLNDKLVKLFGDVSLDNEFWRRIDYDIIYGISQNKQLFLKYSNSNFDKYYDVGEAIYEANDRIIISFTDINLYAVVNDIDDLKRFIINAGDLIDDGVSCRLNQIVLSDQKQKIVFISSDNAEPSIKKFRDYIKKYLNADISTIEISDGIQITVEGYVDNYDQSIIKFNNLQEQIRVKDYKLASAIMLTPRKRSQANKFIDPDISDIINNSAIDEIMKILKSIPLNMQNLTININNLAINGNINNNIPVDKHAIAREWINDNPPNEREITTSYYERYNLAVNNSIHNNQFGKLVRDEGYETVQGRNGRWWKK